MRSWFRWDSLSTKIIIWSFVPTAIILLGVALVTLNAYQDVTKDLVIERDRELTRLSASQFIFELGEYIDLLVAETRTANIYNGEPLNQQVALVQAKNRLTAFDAGVVVLNTFGQVTAALPDRPEILGQDWSDRTYFRDLLRATQGSAFSNIVPDGPNGAEVIGIAVPIIGPQGEFRGVLFGMFHLNVASANAFYGSLVRLRVGESGNMYLVDGAGRIIYHSDANQAGKSFLQQPVVQRVLAGEVGALRTQDFYGQDIVAGFAPVPWTPWGLVTEESWSVLTSDSRGHQKFLFLLLILGVVVPTFVVTFGVKIIMRPIEQLISAAQEVARGNFGQTIKASSQDEIGKLAEQFNSMSAKLQESYTLLEQRVADRTRELSALYEVTAVANQSLELDETLESSINQVLVALHADVGAIQLLDESEEVLHVAIHKGIPSEVTEAMERMPTGVGPGYWIVQNNKPLVVPDITKVENVAEITKTMTPHSYVGVPVRAKKKTLGVLSVAREAACQFNAEDVALLGSIADQIGVAIENARLYEQAEQAAVMEERGRLARDLHDSVTQSLYSVTLFAEAARRLACDGDLNNTRDYVEQLGETSQQALKELRLLVYELRPSMLEHEGLVGALQQRLSTVEERAGVKAELLVQGATDFTESMEETLYRIAQEALNNSLKHAAASAVTVQLNSEGNSVALEVSDNGKGFNPDDIEEMGGIGMMSMRERTEKLGGTLHVISVPGEGTTVQFQVNFKGA